MYDDSDIDAAVSAGALSASDALAMRRFIAGRHAAPVPVAEDRHFRYRVAAGDVLPMLGIVMLLTGLTAIGGAILGPYVGGVIAATAWWLSKRVAHRRLGLPTTLLFVAFALGCATGLAAVGYGPAPAQPIALNPGAGLMVAGGSAIACWLYWRRFRLPLAVPFALIAALTLGDHLLMAILPDPPTALVTAWTLIAAAALFVAAMWWDMSDVYRQTIRSDVAFWSHGLAGFLLSAAIFRALVGTQGGARGWSGLWSVPPASSDASTFAGAVAIVATLGVIAIVIDRRAVLIFGLAFLAAVGRKAMGDAALPALLIVIGAAAIGLTLQWMTLRRLLLGALPIALRAQVPRSDPAFLRERPVA